VHSHLTCSVPLVNIIFLALPFYYAPSCMALSAASAAYVDSMYMVPTYEGEKRGVDLRALL
jgi:hypothetical protein